MRTFTRESVTHDAEGNEVERLRVTVVEDAPDRLDALTEALANATTIAQVRAAAGAARKPEPPTPVEPPTGPDRKP